MHPFTLLPRPVSTFTFDLSIFTHHLSLISQLPFIQHPFAHIPAFGEQPRVL